MANGFIGKSAGKFFTNTGDALRQAGEAHDRDPFEGLTSNRVPFPSLPTARNQTIPFSPDEAWTGSTNARSVGDASNIVVDPDVYSHVMRRVETVDHQAGADIYMVATAIEEICTGIFVVPETVPRILAITSQLKNSLGQFRSLTENANIDIRGFVHAMAEIDHGNTGLLAVSRTRADDVIQRVSTTMNRQVDNMESTTGSYRSQAGNIERML